jgi:hypothetical protein
MMTDISAILKDGSNIDMPALRNYLAAMQASVNALVGNQAIGSLVYATWAELAAVDTGDLADGAGARIYDDAGTHEDPVSGQTVANEGIYGWHSADPAGWQRIANSEAADAKAQAGIAKDWAEGDTAPDPDDPTSKSAKAYAQQAGQMLNELSNLREIATVGKNLFDPADDDFVVGSYITSAGNLTANATYSATGYIPITAGESYIASGGIGSGSTYAAWFDAAKDFISTTPMSATALVAPAGAAFVRETLLAANAATFQIEQGTVATAYTPYRFVVADDALPPIPAGKITGTITLEQTDLGIPSKNLFNPADPEIVQGKYVGSGNGALVTNATYASTGYIPVTAGQTYSRSYSNQMAWFNAAKVYVSGQQSADGAVIVAPATAVFARLTIPAGEPGLTAFQFEQADAPTSYQPYGDTLDPTILPPSLAPLASGAGYLDPNGLPKQGAYRIDRLRRFHSLVYRLGKNDDVQAHWAQIGDSWSHITSRYTGVVAADLFALPGAGDSGPGWQGFGYYQGNGPNGNVRDSIYTMARTGTWDDAGYNASDSPDICSASTTDTSTPAEYTLAGPDASLLNAAEHWYLGTAAGVMQYRWNGGDWTTLDVSGEGLKFADISTNKPEAGAWTLEMQIVSGTWNPCGNYYAATARGMRVSKIAGSGSQCSTWATTSAHASWQAGMARLNPDIISIMLLTNDRTANRSPAQFKADMTTLLTNIRAALPGPVLAPNGSNGTGTTPGVDILIVMPCQSAETGLTYAQNQYVQQVYTLADQFDCGFIDLQRLFGAPGTYDGWQTSGNRHPDVPMSRLIASAITNALTKPW